MQVVRIIIALLGCLQTYYLQSQHLTGKYETSTSIEKKEFSFNGNHRFTTKSSNAFDHGLSYASGYYLVKKDSLILFYDSMRIPGGTSKYEITQKEELKIEKSESDKALVSLTILNSDRKPLKSAIVALCKDKDILAIYPQSDKGEYFIQTEGKSATHIKIFNMVLLEIPLDDLWNYKSDIIALMVPFSHDQYNQTQKIEKYLIKKRGKDRLELEETSGKIIELIKINMP